MITFTQKGNFKNTERFLRNSKHVDYKKILNFYGKAGVKELEKATPADTGLTASSWEYSYEIKNSQITLSWSNTNMEDGIPIVILIQYGHGTRNGGYVQGIDFINPALKQIFKDLTDKVWKEITNI